MGGVELCMVRYCRPSSEAVADADVDVVVVVAAA